MHSSSTFLDLILGAVLCCLIGLMAIHASTSDWKRDPLSYPISIETSTVESGKLIPVDLEGDGTGEFVRRVQVGKPYGHVAVELIDNNLHSIDQIEIRGSSFEDPLLFDVDGDGNDDVLIQVVRNDSLFLYKIECDIIADACKSTTRILIITKEDALGPDPNFEWDPRIVNAYRGDVEADGSDELILVFSTLYAGNPRGIWVASLPESISSDLIEIQDFSLYQVNGQPGAISPPSDYDLDGSLELLIRTFIPDNAVDDKHPTSKRPQIIFLDLAGLKEEWNDAIGKKSGVIGRIGDVLKDERLEVVAWNAKLDQVNIYDLASGRLIESIEKGEGVNVVILPEAKQGKDALLVGTKQGDVQILNEDENGVYWENVFSVGEKIIGLEVLNDIDDDDHPDLSIATFSGSYLVSGAFRLSAFYPEAGYPISGLLSIVGGDDKQLYSLRQGQTVFFDLDFNRLYQFHRSKSWLIVMLSGLGFVLLVIREGLLQKRRLQLKRDWSRKTAELAQANRLSEDQRAHVENMNAELNKFISQTSKDKEELEKENSRLRKHVNHLFLPHAQDTVVMKLATVLKNGATDQDFNVERFAEQTKYSEEHLRRLTKAFAGISPKDLIVRYRVECAAELLRETHLKLEAIAYDTGFSSASHLSNQFKKQYGITPNVYRKDHTQTKKAL